MQTCAQRFRDRAASVVAALVVTTLTLASAGSRSARPDARVLWGPERVHEFAHPAYEEFSRGHYAAVVALAEKGLARALEAHERRAAMSYTSLIAGAELAQFHYRKALEEYLEARRLARATGDSLTDGAILLNISSIYFQMFAFEPALEAAEEGLRIARALGHPYYEPQLQIHLARVLSQTGQKERALALFREGIEQAQMRGDSSLAAAGLADLGDELLGTDDFAGAEAALVESYRLRLFTKDKDLLSSCLKLAALKLAQGDLRTASSLVEHVLSAPAKTFVAVPRFQIFGLRGRIRAAEGRLAAALDDFRTAIDYARQWRGEVLPADAFLTEANAALEERVYRDFVRTAAALYRRTGEQRLAEESFRIEEENRAASLRQSRAARSQLLDRLGSEYGESLARLRSFETQALRGSTRAETEAQRLLVKLAEMESAAGLHPAMNRAENFRTQNSLNHCRDGLSKSDLVLSFYLDASGSYLWTLTRDRLTWQELPPLQVIGGLVSRFRDAIQRGLPEAEYRGEALYRSLFSKLGVEARAKPHWLMELDGPLFEVPFAALVVERRGRTPVYLVEEHTLQIIPALWALESVHPSRSFATFLGVGDPIYNTADERWTKRASLPGLARGASRALMLPRLVGSGQEVEQCAKLWNGPGERASTLIGESATRQRFEQELKQAPAVIHLATHVLLPPSERDEALVALGMESKRQPGMLSASDIAVLRLAGPLVVLDGCRTSAGVVRPGAGLIGLTRAWLLAGASAVIATGWPVPDHTGELFNAFYRHLKRDEPPAEALRDAQLEMASSPGWRSQARYWAAYSLTGGALQ